MRTKRISPFVGLSVLLAVLGASGCGSNEDGSMLSDEQKIQKSHEGRAEYEKAMQSGKPPAASTSNP